MRAGIIAACIITLFAGGVWYVLPHTAGPALPELQVLNDRTIVDYAYNPDGTVAYAYLAEQVPETLVEDEVVALRNETSYTKFIEVVTPGDDPVVKLETRIYSQPAYAQDADGTWKYLEYATTTEQAFRNRDMTIGKYLTELLVRSAYADTLSPFSGAGDGSVASSASEVAPGCTISSRFAVARSAVSGTTPNPTGTSASAMSYVERNPEIPVSCSAVVNRSFFPFDTSAIPPSTSITAASLSIYAAASLDEDNDASAYITVSTSTQATHTTLTTADFDTAGPITMNTASEVIDTGERKDITSISTSAYSTFTFNSNGIAAIKKSGDTSTCTATTGITCLALREGHDAVNDLPADITTTGINIYTSEQTGTSQDPYLTVTYTSTERHLVKLTSGTFKVNGGRFKLQSN